MNSAPRIPRYLKILDTRNAWKIKERTLTENCTPPDMLVISGFIAAVSAAVGKRVPSPPGITVLTASAVINEFRACLLYTSDAADERSSVDLGGRRIIKK